MFHDLCSLLPRSSVAPGRKIAYQGIVLYSPKIAVKEKSMKASMNCLQLILFIAICLAGMIMIVSIAFDHSMHIFRYTGYFMLILFGLLCLDMSGRDTSKNPQTNESIAPYKQSLRRLGIVLLLSAVLSFCIFVLRSLLF